MIMNYPDYLYDKIKQLQDCDGVDSKKLRSQMGVVLVDIPSGEKRPQTPQEVSLKALYPEFNRC